ERTAPGSPDGGQPLISCAVVANAPTRRSWPWRLGLAALLLWALALRAWMAVPALHAGRFWDERYTLQNVEVVLREGRWLPANAYHPTLAYLPQTAVLAVPHALAQATGDDTFAVLAPRGFAPLAYLLVRLVQAIFGTLSIVWLFRVGRRLFDSPTGMLAAALMAVVPWHMRQSVIFKPDILLLLLTLVAFEWALAAYERPTRGRFLRAGAGVGLAIAAKYNGVAAALPLAAGWIAGPGRRRLAGWLALAAAAALATFLLLDPHLLLHPEMLVRDFGATLRDYADKGAQAAAGRGDIVRHAFASLGGATFHGPLVGLLALAGLVWLSVEAARAAPERRRQLSMLLSFPVGYVVAYAAATNNPSDHNWLPIVPFTSLAAAALVVAAGRRLAGHVPLLARRPVLPVAAVLAVLLLAGPSTAYAYRVAVPSTWAEVDRLLLARLGDQSGHRLVWQEGLEEFRVGRRGHRVRKPVLVPPEEARRAGFGPQGTDARVEIEPPAGAATTDGGGRQVEATAMETRWIHPALFRAHGPALRLTSHPWNPAGPPVRLDVDATGFVVPPTPPGPRGTPWVTIEVILAEGAAPPPGLAVEWQGRRLPLFWGGIRGGGGGRFVSPRVAAPEGPSQLRVVGEQPPVVRGVEMWSWWPPEGAAAP
ncbi:MAG TPA: glycosyltransferase family 39 protein, partial [Thermoanaerobaculia bacterium]|nr:glycosyltransferase family 39 protein [Thermoanaerobaculia bacterium]